MEIVENDIIKFYLLQMHYKVNSPNIGIVGSKNKFNKYIKNVCKDLKKVDKVMYSNVNHTRYIVIIDGIEYGYYHIKSTEDLKRKIF